MNTQEKPCPSQNDADSASSTKPFHATLIKKQSYRNRLNGTTAALCTPYYFIGPDGAEHFICTLITQTHDPYYPDKTQRQEMAYRLRSLRRNNYRFMRFHGIKPDPISFLEWVRENDYTLEIFGKLFELSPERRFVDFHGNVCEYSASFLFRIYDCDLFARLLRELKTVKRHHAWRRPKTNATKF